MPLKSILWCQIKPAAWVFIFHIHIPSLCLRIFLPLKLKFFHTGLLKQLTFTLMVLVFVTDSHAMLLEMLSHLKTVFAFQQLWM